MLAHRGTSQTMLYTGVQCSWRGGEGQWGYAGPSRTETPINVPPPSAESMEKGGLFPSHHRLVSILRLREPVCVQSPNDSNCRISS
ncbi:hypothetical protein E2C01_003650 [Portunus trituberculatus]|uniref:Uncharacterized protein n=1 Tax=Portunus trituberculatus TaxID=210409 RepID=A0A5B7CNA2_PORTR|nr:hypothetical protein [Portunus trituberculatus]